MIDQHLPGINSPRGDDRKNKITLSAKTPDTSWFGLSFGPKIVDIGLQSAPK